MKKIIVVFFLFIAFGCKSVKETKNNKLDVTSLKVSEIENNFSLTEIDLETKEIILISADPKKEVTITDVKGKKRSFGNVKEVRVTSKKEIKKDSVIQGEKRTLEKVVDKSIIKETAESVSDTKNF